MNVLKLIILGQPRTGKSTLARILSEELGFPIVCTDKYRREWGFHEPWKGHDTEISFHNRKKFYQKLLELYESYDNLILEGSAIHPDDLSLFSNDGAVLLYRRLSAREMLKFCRKYDSDWTIRRDDAYLLNLFEEYIKFSNQWVKEHQENSVDTTNYLDGLNKAKAKLLEKDKNSFV